MKFFSPASICFLLLLSCATKKEENILFNQPQRTIVAGKIINPSAEEKSIRLAINRIGMNQDAIDSDIDSTGAFRFEFEAYVPADAWLVYQTSNLILFHPGDSVYIELTEDTEADVSFIKFTGDAAETNRSASSFLKSYYESELYNSDELEEHAIKNYDLAQYKFFADSLRTVSNRLFDDYVQKEVPDDEVKQWALHFLNRIYYSNLYFYPQSHRKALLLKQSEWTVPASFYDFLKEEELNNNSWISSQAISSYASMFMFGYIREHAREKIKKGIAEGLIRKEEAEKYSVLDSVMLQTLQEDDHASPVLKEMALTSFMSNLLDESNIEEYEELHSFADKHIRSSFLRAPLLSRYSETKAKQEQRLSPSAMAAAQSFDGDPIALIRKKNKGKVIFIDIWATWCGPCREEFPYSKKLEEKFNHEVVFAYVCIDSEHDAYINALKKYQLGGIHYFLEKEQNDKLREHYKLDGIPHYLLLDKNGNVAGEGYKIKPSEDTTYGKIKSVLESDIE